MPRKYAAAAMATWPKSLRLAPSGTRSSHNPSPNMARATAMIFQLNQGIMELDCQPSNALNSKTTDTKAAASATPPRRDF